MAKDEESKTPPFQLFQQPSRKAEPPPSEKANQQPPLPFQQPPVFEKTPTPPPAPVKPPPAVEEKPRPVRDHTAIKPARLLSGLTARKKKALWIIAGVLVAGLASYFILTSVLKEPDAPAATAAAPLEKKEKPPSPKPTPASPSTKLTKKGMVRTENGGVVNMRTTPSEDGTSFTAIPTGAEVVIFRYGEETALNNGEKGRWCRVAYRGEVGWVWGKFVKEK